MGIGLLPPMGRDIITSMSHQHQEKSRGGAMVAIITLLMIVVLAVLYVLSLGPAVALYPDGRPPYWYNVFYAPLLWLAESSPTVRALLEAYVGLFDSPG